MAFAHPFGDDTGYRCPRVTKSAAASVAPIVPEVATIGIPLTSSGVRQILLPYQFRRIYIKNECPSIVCCYVYEFAIG